MVYQLVILLVLGLFQSQQHIDSSKKISTNSKHRGSMTISEVLHKYTDRWMAITGVIGTGEGEANGKPCIKVFVIKKTPLIKKKIPASVEGFPVVLEKTGTIRAR